MEISTKRLRELEDSEAKLNALEVGGVGKWEWYDESLTGYFNEIERRNGMDDLYNAVEEAIGEGLEEPAGHGCGYGVKEDASDNARKILKDGIDKILKIGS